MSRKRQLPPSGTFGRPGLIFSAAALGLLLFLAGPRGLAQTPGAKVRGTVQDPEGSPVAGVRIIARQVGSDFAITTMTEENGSYSLNSLPPGIYRITVTKPGFAYLTQEEVNAGSAGETVRLHFRLRPSEGQVLVRGEEELNPNVFVLKLDSNEILRELRQRGANVELLREFRSEPNYYGAIYGYPLRAVDWLKPRKPLREFHGSLYEAHQNSALNARTFFTVGKLKPSRRNQYGAAANGPILQDRASFQFAWSQLRETGYVNGNVQIPLLEERIPRSENPAINAAIQTLLAAYPNEEPNLTQISPRLHNTNAVRNIRNTAFSTRFDIRLREETQLAFQQGFLDYSEEPFEMVIGQNPVSFLRPQSYHLTLTQAFSPRTLSRFSYHFDRLGASFDITDRYKDLLAPLGYQTAPNFNVGGDFSALGPGPNYPFRRVENRFYVSAEIIRVHDGHTMTAGVSFNRLQFNDSEAEQGRGVFGFSRDRPEGGPGPDRSAAENFLLGLPSTFEIDLGDPYRGFRNWENAFYWHDTIRVNPHWTLSLGLRYEVITKPTEVNRLSSFPFSTDANNFAPQFGFAWNPKEGRTVVRGGYGMTYGTIPPLLYQRVRFNPPAMIGFGVPSPNLLDPLRGVDRAPDGTEPSEMKLMSPDLVTPYAHLYSLQIQRELPANWAVTLGYLGERTIQLPVRFVYNRAEPVAGIELSTETINRRRPDPRFLQITETVNGAMAYFDALQIAVNRRSSRGLTLNVRYTFSKAISTADAIFADIAPSTASVSQSSEIVSDLKGVAKFDIPHALVIGYSYEFPRRPTRGLLSALLGGWRISGTTTFKSGTPFSVHAGSDAPGFGNVDGVRGADRPNLLDPKILGQSFDHPDTSRARMGVDSCKRTDLPGVPRFLQCQYFDTNILSKGRGNIGYNTFRNDGIHNWNLALEKEFSLREAGTAAPHLLVRAESLNFLNQPQFAEVISRLAADTFGYITNTANKGRVTQLLLKLRW